jgi:ribosome-binding protein aMBF1 (putative translation factor)
MRNGHNRALPLTYTFEIEIDLVKLDPKYPKDPRTLGDHIRKARMDRHLMVKELAKCVGVVPETVINWEKRNLTPTRKHMERIRAVLGLNADTVGSSQRGRQSQS